MKWREQAAILKNKAAEDLYILQVHQKDSKVSDELWGFHAQQAVEKLLKAMLAHAEIAFPYTHRLTELADLLEEAKIAFPEDIESLLDLTPYAAELRYGILPRESGATPLDRAGILKLIERLHAHVSSIV